MRCVSYVRDVNCFGEKISIPEQERRIDSFAREHNLELVCHYVDSAGNVETESAFQRMKTDGMQRRFDLVLVDSITSCGESVSDAEDVLVKIFLRAGIQFALVDCDFFSIKYPLDAVCQQIIKMKQTVNGRKLKQVDNMRAAEGLLSCHDERYGYLLAPDSRGLVIDEEAAQIIRMIFAQIANGVPSWDVANELNAKGVDTPGVHLAKVSKKNYKARCSQWTDTRIFKIIHNRNYIGELQKSAGGENWTIRIPPIVEEGLFVKSNAVIASRRVTSPNVRIVETNPFAGKIYDRDSGRPLQCRGFQDQSIRRTFRLLDNRTPEEHGLRLWIEYDRVQREAVNVLKHEFASAQNVMRILGTEEAEHEKLARLDLQIEKLKEKAFHLDKCLKDRIELVFQFQRNQIDAEIFHSKECELLDRIELLDKEFSDILIEIDRIEIAFSYRNPWIKSIGFMQIDDELTKKQVGEYIKRVEIVAFKEVYITVRNAEWKEQLPTDWMVT